MKRLIGYTMFWIAVGLILGLLICETWIIIIIIAILLIIGYNLFSCY